MAIQLREVTKDTVRAICALTVRKAQQVYVAPNAVSIAQAYFEPTAVFRAVYLREQPIGFIQWRQGDAPTVGILWRFMVDRKYQSSGHGRVALTLALQEMKASGYDIIETSVILGSSTPLSFYLSQGFTEVGQSNHSGEWVLRKRFEVPTGP